LASSSLTLHESALQYNQGKELSHSVQTPLAHSDTSLVESVAVVALTESSLNEVSFTQSMYISSEFEVYVQHI